MFSKSFILFVLTVAVIFSGNVVHAQFLLFDGEQQRAGSVTVGTTTYNFSLPQSSLKSAQVRLQEIYTYIRDFDSAEIAPSIQDNYSSISGVTFGNEGTFDRNIASSTNKCPFTKGLTIGSQDEEVVALQKFLNSYPETRVAQSGIGSPGNETDYFGILTFNAVFAFQAQYADEILAPIGIENPTGYWGEATRTYAHTLLGC
ncbi:peptidoglycan-binding protein [Candidatus Kaiserbacteria bacterium]|nr:MAG: peptidoglycan-binding protein [Candidatus Kaiserbacteria bacterium]